MAGDDDGKVDVASPVQRQLIYYKAIPTHFRLLGSEQTQPGAWTCLKAVLLGHILKCDEKQHLKGSYSPMPTKAALYPSAFRVLRVMSFTERLLPQLICKKQDGNNDPVNFD